LQPDIQEHSHGKYIAFSDVEFVIRHITAVSGIRPGRGLVTMNGQIQESACSIHTDDIWQEIPFGVISYSDLNQEGKRSSNLLRFGW
jgi:type 1 fimbria pilin